VPPAGDGIFSIKSGAEIKLVDLKTNTTKTLVNAADIKDVRPPLSILSSVSNFATGTW